MAPVASSLSILVSLAFIIGHSGISLVTCTPLADVNNDLVLGAKETGKEDIKHCFQNTPPVREISCPTNEHYECCGPICQESCIKYTCPLNCCVEGCFCDEGYARGPSGTCIRKYECFLSSVLRDETQDFFNKECGSDEHISCASLCQRNCSNYNNVIPCNLICFLGCVCTPPKIRGPDGNCILPQQCPSPSGISEDSESDSNVCGPDESLKCESHCQKNCSNCNEIITCPKICVKGCVCNSPKIRGPHGDCILPEQCTNSLRTRLASRKPEAELCGPDQTLSWESHCQRDCTNYREESIACPLIKILGCVCKRPKIRGPDGKCISPDQCSTPFLTGQVTRTPAIKQCGPDEFLSSTSHCQRDCTNHHQESIACPHIVVWGCVCKEPKIRGPDGNCIHSDQYPAEPSTEQESSFTVCKHDEILSWESLCQRDCTNYQEENIACPLIKVLGCVCQQPKVRGHDGNCMLPEQCPVPLLTKREENMKKTAMLCNFLQIQENPLKRSRVCPIIAPPVCPENEIFLRGDAHCEDTCNTHGHFMHCPRICVEGCVCVPPLIRSPDGKCVKVEDCPKRNETSICPENEEWSICNFCSIKDCDNYDQKSNCSVMCSPGCSCIAPRVRGPDGRCILIEECPPRPGEMTACAENEEWDVCGTACPRNCSTYNEPAECTKQCERGCFCKEPRVRGPNGDCILIEECPESVRPFCPVNEYYDECGARCQISCENFDKLVVCPDICEVGCLCKAPLVRGPDGTCISVAECPAGETTERSEDPECPENEIYDDCYANCQRNCTSIDGPLVCPLMCEAGCICKPPLVRGPDGSCVNVEQCIGLNRIQVPICPVDEYYDECSARCQKDCTNYDKIILCPLICEGGCICRPPMVRGPNGTCIHTAECRSGMSESAECPENEVYDMCDGNCPKTCSNFDGPLNCPHECEAGCVCDPPLVRGPDGTCIDVQQCDTREEGVRRRILERRRWGFFPPRERIVCPVREYYEECSAHCQKDCTNYNKRFFCTFICQSGCVCRPPLIRGPSGTCINAAECRTGKQVEISVSESVECPENEVYDMCDGNCPKTCYNFDGPLICPHECEAGCVCDPPLVRGPDGTCIDVEQCDRGEVKRSGKWLCHW